MTVYDIRNQDTEDDFHTLTKGLFVLAHKNGYLPYWRRLVKHESWGSRIKNYVYVEGRADIILSNQGVNGELRTILNEFHKRDASQEALYVPRLPVSETFALVVDVPNGAVGHTADEEACAVPSTLARIVERELSARLRPRIDKFDVVQVIVKGDNLRTICGHPRHA